MRPPGRGASQPTPGGALPSPRRRATTTLLSISKRPSQRWLPAARSHSAALWSWSATSPRKVSRPPGGPVGRAKTFRDALHDDRRSGPRYTDLSVPAPLAGDHSSCVRGLAIEVRAGEPQTEYQIGTTITAAGQRRASVPVWRAAQNDIAATDAEQARISAARAAFGHAVREAFGPGATCLSWPPTSGRSAPGCSG